MCELSRLSVLSFCAERDLLITLMTTVDTPSDHAVLFSFVLFRFVFYFVLSSAIYFISGGLLTYQTSSLETSHRPLLVLQPPRWPSGKASASRAEDHGFESRLPQDFFGV